MRGRRSSRRRRPTPAFAMAYWGEAMTFNHAGVAAHLARPREGRAREAGARRPMRAAPRRRPKKKRTGSARSRGCYGPGRKARARSRLRRRDAAHARQVSGRRRSHVVLRAGDARHQPRRPRLLDLHARRRARRAGLCEEPAASRRRALPDSRLRRSGPRAARPALRGRLLEDRAVGVACAAHAVAHLRRDGHVGRVGGDQRAIGEGRRRAPRGEEARRRSARLPRAALARLQLHAAGPLRRRARRARADGSGREGKRLGAHPQPPRAGARGVADRDAQVGRGEGAGGVEGPAEGRGDRRAVRDRLRGGAHRATAPAPRTRCSRWRR